MKVSLSTKMNVPLCRKSLFFELDNEILAPVLLYNGKFILPDFVIFM